jgi:hypothetical protein
MTVTLLSWNTLHSCNGVNQQSHYTRRQITHRPRIITPFLRDHSQFHLKLKRHTVYKKVTVKTLEYTLRYPRRIKSQHKLKQIYSVIKCYVVCWLVVGYCGSIYKHSNAGPIWTKSPLMLLGQVVAVYCVLFSHNLTQQHQQGPSPGWTCTEMFAEPQHPITDHQTTYHLIAD